MRRGGPHRQHSAFSRVRSACANSQPARARTFVKICSPTGIWRYTGKTRAIAVLDNSPAMVADQSAYKTEGFVMGGSPQATILIVDDMADVRALLHEALLAEGHYVLEASDKDSLFACLENTRVQLITLDLKLGDHDGLQLAIEIRSRFNIPIIMITGLDNPIDRIRGLENGADDYITKPFHLREVVLRVRRVLNRYIDTIPEHDSATVELRFAFDHCCLDTLRRELRTSTGEIINLTGLEIQLLELFLKHPGRVLSRDEICQSLKGQEWSPLDRTIDGHVARLRRKIEPQGDEPTMIKSVRNVGYVFAGLVSRI